jgi:hypothetical protein
MQFIRPVSIDDDAKLIASSVPETAPLYNPATSYMADEEVRVGHLIYKSAAGNNVGHPVTDPAWWLGPKFSNRWAAFDGVNATKTVAEEVSFTVRPGQLIDSLALLDVSATAVTVVAVSAVQGEVYNKTFLLSNEVPESDFWVWFFEPIVRKKVLFVPDLPMMADLDVTVTLEGDNQSLATFSIGNLWTMGGTEYGAEIGIDDYSKYIDNGFGDETLIQGAYSKRGNFTVYCSKDVADATADVLTEYRATNLVWIASKEFNSTVIFGYAKSWRAVISYPTIWVYSLEIKGRT